jgi:hypothetical protein
MSNHSLISPPQKLLISLLVLVAAVCLSNATAKKAKPVNNQIDAYFSGLIKEFDKITNNPETRTSKIARIDKYLRKTLYTNNSFYSFIRANSKGTVISEVVRGKVTPRNYRKIAGQKSFTHAKQKKKPYYSLYKTKNGRRYLLWCNPILRGNSKQFVGALLVKIDLVDCLHEFAKTNPPPFLVKLEGKTIYSHVWEMGSGDAKIPFKVPGVEKIMVTYQGKPSKAAEPEKVAAAKASSKPEDIVPGKEKAKAPKKEGSVGEQILSEIKEKSDKKATAKAAEEEAAAMQTDKVFGKKKKKKASIVPYIGIALIVLLSLTVGAYLVIQNKREKESIL